MCSKSNSSSIRESVSFLNSKMSFSRNKDTAFGKAVTEYSLPSFSMVKFTVMSTQQFFTNIDLLQLTHLTIFDPGFELIFFWHSLLLHARNELTATLSTSGQQMEFSCLCSTMSLMFCSSAGDIFDVSVVVKHLP